MIDDTSLTSRVPVFDAVAGLFLVSDPCCQVLLTCHADSVTIFVRTLFYYWFALYPASHLIIVRSGVDN